MPETLDVRPEHPSDFPAWKSLWDGYNTFYDRAGRLLCDRMARETGFILYAKDL